jgi:hypothetical protein
MYKPETFSSNIPSVNEAVIISYSGIETALELKCSV